MNKLGINLWNWAPGLSDACCGLPTKAAEMGFTALELPTGDIEAEIADRCTDDMFDVAALRRLAKANADWGTEKTGLVYADAIARWLAAAPPTRAEELLAEIRDQLKAKPAI